MLNPYFYNPFNSKRDRKFTITLLSLCIIYIIPIILADRYYIDDLGRSQWGYASWSDNGRPLASLIMHLLNFGGANIIDISPLTQILAVLVFVFSSYYYFKSNFADSSPIFSAVTFFFAFANPFLLENLSYKFDSLPMVMALSLLMFAFLRVSSKIKSWLLSFSVILASLCLYQAAIGFFVCLAIMEFVQQYMRPSLYQENHFYIYKDSIARITQLLSAYIVYTVLISPKYVVGDYNVSHSKSIELNNSGINIFLKNVDIYFDIISIYFTKQYYQLAIITFFLSCWLLMVILKKINTKKNISFWGFIIPSIIVLFSPALIFFSSFLPLSFLANPQFAARTLISFSGVMLFWGRFSFYIVNRWRITIVFLMPIVLFFFIFSYSYGNALKAQKNFDATLSGDIISNINEIDVSSSKIVGIYGVQPSSSVRDNTVKRYPLMGSLVPIYMSSKWRWGEVLLNNHGLKNKRGLTVNNELVCAMTPSVKKSNYTLYSNDSAIVIAFKKPQCK